MKFFYRTFNSFIGVIVLQALLVIVLVSGSVAQGQEQDARQELKSEALNVFDNFNSWKRSLWGALVDLNKSTALGKMTDSQHSGYFDDAIEKYIGKMAAQAGGEFLVLKNSWSAFTAVRPLTDRPLPSPESSVFQVLRTHPYIEMVLTEGILYFCGTVRATSESGRFVDIFILKRVDEQMIRQLSFNQRTKVLVSLNGHFIIGTIPGENFMEWMRGRTFPTSYSMLDEFMVDGIPNMVVVQQSGTARIAEGTNRGEATLYVCTFLSLAEYRARIEAIRRAIIIASLIVALFTIIVSAGLGKAVTKPVSLLGKAMAQLKAGNKHVSLSGPVKGEIADLFHGFNDMAFRIDKDSEELAVHIRNITAIQEYNDKIFNSIQEKILVINSRFVVERANKAFLDYAGRSEESVVGSNIDVLSLGLFDEPVHASIRAIVSGASASIQQTRRTTSGRTFDIKLYPLLQADEGGLDNVHCIMVIDDVTERLAYEEKIRQAEKLASISMLSAGVAHEINNPLSAILTNVQNLIKAEKRQEKIQDLQLVEQETKRIAKIVRNLLDFSSSRHSDTSGADVNATISNVLRLVSYSIRNETKISIDSVLDQNIPRTSAGEDELKQIILNLIRNSLESIDTGGAIRIATRFETVSSMIECVVSDTGKGIPADVLPRIFDPFFSTKSGSGNSGLGLSVVYGLVSKFGGTIDVGSAEGEGTVVMLRLPIEPEGKV
jgi:PAS domain S-box-containing protein